MVNVVLVEPRIPGNVGTIGRLCYAINATLHLIKPYGFGEITSKEVKKAGLDYWEYLDVFEYNNLNDFWSKNRQTNRHFFTTTKVKENYFNKKYMKNDFIYFGREDAGLDNLLLNKNKKNCITIPMVNEARSLNIANAVSIISYEVVKQNINKF